MIPSQTVENYLKTIFLAQLALSQGDGSDAEQMVPMGQVATSLGVVPGTATTMIKTLAESGLVHYEPYVGVRLTAAGEKLAGMVLRRHRLIEAFLVKILGMSWADVHDEAERLEHAVSDQVIDRIDALLGRPSVDPHGDPIPTPEGRVPRVDDADLLGAPVNVALVVTRVTDQSPEFLRFVEQHDLVPGRPVTVLAREANAESVRLRGASGEARSIPVRAASKILVR